MKKIKFFSIAMTIIAIVLSIWLYKVTTEKNRLAKDLAETEEILDMCSDRYYKEMNIKSSQ